MRPRPCMCIRKSQFHTQQEKFGRLEYFFSGPRRCTYNIPLVPRPSRPREHGRQFGYLFRTPFRGPQRPALRRPQSRTHTGQEPRAIGTLLAGTELQARHTGEGAARSRRGPCRRGGKLPGELGREQAGLSGTGTGFRPVSSCQMHSPRHSVMFRTSLDSVLSPCRMSDFWTVMFRTSLDSVLSGHAQVLTEYFRKTTRKVWSDVFLPKWLVPVLGLCVSSSGEGRRSFSGDGRFRSQSTAMGNNRPQRPALLDQPGAGRDRRGSGCDATSA